MIRHIKLIYHDDPDGWASARVFYIYLRDNIEHFIKQYEEKGLSFSKECKDISNIEYIPINYGYNIPDVSNSLVIMLDFSVQPHERFINFIDRVEYLIWIDHHKTAKEFIDSFLSTKPSNLEYHVEIGKGACELVFNYLRKGWEIPLWLDLISNYDVWNFKYNDLHLYLIDYMNTHKSELRQPNKERWKEIEKIIEITKVHFYDPIIEGKLSFNKWLTLTINALNDIGSEKTIFGRKCYVVNYKGMNSLPFERFDKSSNSDIWVSFFFDNKHNMWTVSLYSKKVDVSEIAKQFGGGGHKNAAGFQCNTETLKEIGII